MIKKMVLIALAIASLAVASIGSNNSNFQTASAINSQKMDPAGDSLYLDFDIKSHFIDSDGSLNLQVHGFAGNTLPEDSHDAYAYVIVTNNGIYAADSHEAQHADDEQVANKAWHGHKVVVAEDGCITGIGSFKSQAKLAGTNVKITATGATEITKTMTVLIKILVDDPDNPPKGAKCIAKVHQVFDEAVLSR